jgi:chlorobactene glucosyltransferase
VLIPARDEEARIPILLEDLARSGFANLEILVYDDNSRDMTKEIVTKRMQQDDRIRLLEGGTLPAGWLGKNHACHHLAAEAKGSYLLFLDADVRVSPDLITDSLAFMESNKLDLLSLFPVQLMGSFGERITVPLINWVLVSLLPLWLTGRTRQASLAAANGQFMMFRREPYVQHSFHEMFKDNMVEDIHIIKKMKAMGYRVQTLLSNGQVTCRMYTNYQEALNGFSKNVKAFFGNNWLLMASFGILTAFGPLFVGLAMPVYMLWAYMAGVFLLRGIISVISRQNWLLNSIFLPLQVFSFWVIMIRGSINYLFGTMTWKGRRIR